jgi:hypothetical protein
MDRWLATVKSRSLICDRRSSKSLGGIKEGHRLETPNPKAFNTHLFRSPGERERSSERERDDDSGSLAKLVGDASRGIHGA